MTTVLNATIPYDPFAERPLPGIGPLEPGDWLQVNEAYAAQMAERARILREMPERVLWLDPGAQAAARELLDLVLERLPTGFTRQGGAVICPDGRRVEPDRDAPLQSLGALVAEDFCLLVREGEEHVLRGAILCFPAGWTLAEKAGRPLVGIHKPVASYDGTMARRVQRLFDAIRPERPMWRFNRLWYDDPALFQPRTEGDPRPMGDPERALYLRSERQSLLRLPDSGAVVFSIHTYMLPRAAVSSGTGAASG